MTETGDFGEPFGEAPTAEEAGPMEPAEGTAGDATGHQAVDEVLASLEGLDERPVAEHVAVFEQAHEQFRRALSQPGDRA